MKTLFLSELKRLSSSSAPTTKYYTSGLSREKKPIRLLGLEPTSLMLIKPTSAQREKGTSTPSTNIAWSSQCNHSAERTQSSERSPQSPQHWQWIAPRQKQQKRLRDGCISADINTKIYASIDPRIGTLPSTEICLQGAPLTTSLVTGLSTHSVMLLMVVQEHEYQPQGQTVNTNPKLIVSSKLRFH